MLIGYLENLGSDRRIISSVSMRLDMLFFIGYDIDETLGCATGTNACAIFNYNANSDVSPDFAKLILHITRTIFGGTYIFSRLHFQNEFAT